MAQSFIHLSSMTNTRAYNFHFGIAKSQQHAGKPRQRWRIRSSSVGPMPSTNPGRWHRKICRSVTLLVSQHKPCIRPCFVHSFDPLFVCSFVRSFVRSSIRFSFYQARFLFLYQTIFPPTGMQRFSDHDRDDHNNNDGQDDIGDAWWWWVTIDGYDDKDDNGDDQRVPFDRFKMTFVSNFLRIFIRNI